MHYLYKTNFKFIYDDNFYNLFLEYLIKKTGLKQNELVDKIKVSSATFTRAKRNGYVNNKTACKALEDYFNVNERNIDTLIKFEKYLNELLTYTYYSETFKEKEILLDVLKYDEKTKNTPLRLLFWALISISYNPQVLESKHAIEILDEDLDYVLYMLDYLDIDNKYIMTYALYEYALHKDDYKLAISYRKQIEELIPQISDRLQSLANFIGMSASIFDKDYSKAIKYINRSLELQNIYFAPKMSVSVKYHLFVLYSLILDYEKMADLGEREILYLQFQPKEQAFYFCYLLGLAQAYIVLERYDDAKGLFDIIDNYDLEENIISKGQIKPFDNKRQFLKLSKLFMYYKEKNTTMFEETLVECSPLNQDDYVEVIKLLKKGNINSLKKAYKQIQAIKPVKLTQELHNILTKELQTLLNK